MADENFTLTTIYNTWKEYQGRIVAAVAPLTAEQLALRAAPNLRSIGENAAHILGCRAGWFTDFLGEESSDAVKAYATWDESGAPARTAAELVEGLQQTGQLVTESVARWSPDDMRKIYYDDWDGKQVPLSRAWVVAHVLEHDLHHGGELSFTLGMHGIPADFPG